MFEDKGMIKFIYAFLSFVAIFTPGPIFPIGISILFVGLLIYKIKRAKESPDAYLSLMFDIAIIVVVILVNIGILALRISVEKKHGVDSISSFSGISQELDSKDVAEYLISEFKTNNPKIFNNNAKEYVIKNRFKTFLEDEYDFFDIVENGNTITCSPLDEKITFTISKTGITYTIN